MTKVDQGQGRSGSDAATGDAPNSEDAAVAHDEYRRLGACISELPTRQREVLVCRYLLDMSEAETSQALDIGIGSVKQHAHRARTTLHD